MYLCRAKKYIHMQLMDILHHSTPLVTDPTWVFFLVLSIILFAPLLLRRLRVPPIIGLILAGIIVGQHGLNVLERDSSFELFGQVGIYYIMFLAGLELDMGSVIHYGRRGLHFGVLTFIIPFVLGFATTYWLLKFDTHTSLMMASLYASHTLVSYPIVSRYGLHKHPAVIISVVATAFAIFVSLLVLAFTVGSRDPQADTLYWLMFVTKCIVYVGGVILLFPVFARRFLRRYDDSVMQFVFVLSLVFLSAALAKLAGLEGLLGAFLSGLVINRLIPHTSPLMTRLQFVGNALFIPYFLIGVGMIIDVRIIFSSFDTLKTIAVVVGIAMLTKWISAWIMNMREDGTKASRILMFGLTNAHAAGALAIVMIGTSIGLMDDTLLNATVMLILFSCIVSSLATNQGAQQLALSDTHTEQNKGSYHGKCLVTYDHPETVDRLTQFAILIRNPFIHDSLMGLSVTFDEEGDENDRSLSALEESGRNASLHQSKHNLKEAKRIAAAADVQMTTLCRVSTNIASGILHTMKEHDVGEVILGMHLIDGNAPAGSLGMVVDGVLNSSHREVMVLHPTTTPGTIHSVTIVVPQKAEFEIGFYKWVEHICRIGEQLDCRLHFYGWDKTLGHIATYLTQNHSSLRSECHIIKHWNDAVPVIKNMSRHDMLVVVASRPDFLSYDPIMDQIPQQLSQLLQDTSVMLLYPDQYATRFEGTSMLNANPVAVTRGVHKSPIGRLMVIKKPRKRKR